MEQTGDVKKPIQRSIVLGGSLFLLVLVVLLSVIAYFVLSTSVYTRYDTKLRDVITFVEHNIDADDLETCIKTGAHSQKYDELQKLLNGMVDDFELEYLYIVIPKATNMTNVISATSEEERAAGESDLPLLEELDAYSAEELAHYLSYWNEDKISYFKELSDYGEYYTACKPLRNSEGATIALICADLSIDSLSRSLATLFVGIALSVIVLLGLFGAFATQWIRRNITAPLQALERSAQAFASRSHDIDDIGKLEFDPPAIHVENEVESLASAITKMANDIRDHAGEILAAQTRADDAERDNVRLAKEAEAAAKIAELSQSVTSLFANMPGLTFSKDAKTGTYLACNQAFAEYARKTDPSGVVGLTDHEIFDATTAQHFVDDDAKALSMDKPYVFFEDVFDAAGNPRQFQTTKMKFYDTKGRLCSLGMSVDVTELMSAQRDTVEARRAYEEARDASITYLNIARALSSDYLRIHYVDVETDRYITYRHDDANDNLLIDREGEDFFGAGRRGIRDLVYEGDKDAFNDAFTKENVLQSVIILGSYTLTYRVYENGEPVYMNLKASRIKGDERHLVVGVSNVDVQMKYQEELRRAREERTTIARITALSGDYLAIYAVDPETNHYKEYRVSDAAHDVFSLKEGDDFFRDALKSCENLVYRNDFGIVQSLLVKERIIGEAKDHGVFAMTFRIVVNDAPLYVSLRAALVEEEGGHQLIVGISDVDSQVKRDQEFATAQNRANQDALTGVRNKFAYADMEDKLNREIAEGKALQFGIAVCDLNDLKLTNDTLGHQAGDALLKQACKTICNVFKHSPVFRIGGDEFAVILQGHDYEHIDELVAELAATNEANVKTGDAIVAWGVSEYHDGDDVAAVFKRADDAMYRNKRQLKAAQENSR